MIERYQGTIETEYKKKIFFKAQNDARNYDISRFFYVYGLQRLLRMRWQRLIALTVQQEIKYPGMRMTMIIR